MIPEKLTLTNFRGIARGMQRSSVTIDLTGLDDDDQLISLQGPNGKGKTTILDNLQPYRLMPSKINMSSSEISYSPSAFSFYEHVNGPEASKVLEWSYRGMRYKSIFEFKITAKTNKSIAYLQYHDGDTWQAYVHPDGTSSDGKNKTYDHCINHILGSPNLYFTTAFSAQNKKPLTLYKNAEIKGLLAELLDLSNSEQLSEKCRDIVTELQKHINGLKQKKSELGIQVERKPALASELEATEHQMTGLHSEIESYDTLLTDANKKHGALLQQREVSDRSKERRDAIHAELEKLQNQRQESVATVRIQEENLDHEIALLKAGHRDYMTTRQERINKLDADILKYHGLLEQKDTLIQAKVTFQDAQERANKLQQESTAMSAQYKDYRDAKSDLDTFTATHTAVNAKIDVLTQQAERYQHQAQLMTEVPCINTELQPKCKLLQDAMEAKNNILVTHNEIQTKQAEAAALGNDITACRARIDEIGYNADQHAQIDTNLHIAREELRSLESAIEQASHIREYEALLATAQGQISEDRLSLHKAQEKFLLDQEKLDKRREDIAAQHKEKQVTYYDRHESLMKELSQLPQTADINQQIGGIENEITRFTELKNELSEKRNTISEKIAAIRAQITLTDEAATRLVKVKSQITSIAIEIEAWQNMSVAFGKNGIIALSIDDAGPSIAAIANDILYECYGPRFSVAIETQAETKTGKQQETFDIKVYDSHADDSESISYMSGGEKIWILDAVVRAIALFRAQQSEKNYECLFADESDGALDPEHKRMYMKTKRSILKLGNYKREIFITHTEELHDDADFVIDLSQYKES